MAKVSQRPISSTSTNVCFWHKADIDFDAELVCFRRKADILIVGRCRLMTKSACQARSYSRRLPSMPRQWSNLAYPASQWVNDYDGGMT